MRTTPKISDLFAPLETCISEKIIPALFNQYDSKMRKLISLPAKLGGLGIFIPSDVTETEYAYSKTITAPLVELIIRQELSFDPLSSIGNKIKIAKSSIAAKKLASFKTLQASLMVDDNTRSIIHHQTQKGTSLWLTTLPIANLGFVMNSTEFHDALCLRYNVRVANTPKFCACSKVNSVENFKKVHN